MTRRYAQIVTAIWRDPDFRKLTCGAQRMFLLLVSQPNISGAGTLPLTVGRWAAMAADTKPAAIRDALEELSATRFVVVDEDTEELLVRSFVRWDGGYGNIKRRPVIERAAGEVMSDAIRRALGAEFERLGLPTAWVTGQASDRASDSASGDRRTFRDSLAMWDGEREDAADHRQIETGTYSQENRVSDRASDTPPDRTTRFDGVVDTKGEWLDATTHNPQPPLPSQPDAAHKAPATVLAPGEGEGEENREDREKQLIATIRKSRPEWSINSIRRAVRDEDVRDRPWPVIAAALTVLANDPRTTAPGRLRADGPWWADAANATRTGAADLPPPCGKCGPNRLIEVPGGVMRCPDCHPLRRSA